MVLVCQDNLQCGIFNIMFNFIIIDIISIICVIDMYM